MAQKPSCKVFITPVYQATLAQVEGSCKSHGTIVDRWHSYPPKHFLFVTMSTPDEARRVVAALNNTRIGKDTIVAQISHDRPDENYSEQRKNVAVRPPAEPRTGEHAQPRRVSAEYPPRFDDARYPHHPPGPPGAPHALPPPAAFRGDDRRAIAPLPPHHDPYYPRGPDPRDPRAADPRQDPRERFDPRYPPRGYYPPPPRDYYPPPAALPPGGGRDRDRSYYDPYYAPYPPRFDPRLHPAYPPPYGYPPRFDEPRRRERGGRLDGRDDRRAADPRDVSCYNCNRTGHTSRSCPLPPTQSDQCFHCRKLGHQFKDCPSKKDHIPLESLEGYDPQRTDQPTSRPGGTKAERRRAAAAAQKKQRAGGNQDALDHQGQEHGSAEQEGQEQHGDEADHQQEHGDEADHQQEHGDEHQDDQRGGDEYDDQRGAYNEGYAHENETYYTGDQEENQNQPAHDAYASYDENGAF